MHYISCLNSEQKLGLKQMINQEECTIPIVTLDLRPQC